MANDMIVAMRFQAEASAARAEIAALKREFAEISSAATSAAQPAQRLEDALAGAGAAGSAGAQTTARSIEQVTAATPGASAGVQRLVDELEAMTVVSATAGTAGSSGAEALDRGLQGAARGAREASAAVSVASGQIEAMGAASRASAQQIIEAVGATGELATVQQIVRAAINPLVAEYNELQRAMADTTMAEDLGAISAREAALAMDGLSRKATEIVSAMEAAGTAIDGSTVAVQRQDTALQQLINRNVGLGSATEESTAQQLRYGQALDQLRAQFDPLFAASRRYELELREIAEAESAGAISAMAAAAARERAAAALAPMPGQLQRIGASAQTAAAYAGQLTYQLNDIGMMMAMGQSPFMLMVQQGPQVVQVFNAMRASGMAIGPALRAAFVMMLNPMSLVTMAAIGVGAAIVQHFSAAKEETKSFGDAIKELENTTRAVGTAMTDARLGIFELRKEFGEGAITAREMNIALLDLARIDALDKLMTSADGLKAKFSGLTEQINLYNQAMMNDGVALRPALRAQHIRDEFGLTISEANRVVSALQRMGDSSNIDGVIAGSRELANVLSQARDESGNIPPKLRETARAAAEAAIEALRLKGFTEEADRIAQAFAKNNMASPVSSAANEAARLAANMRSAAYFASVFDAQGGASGLAEQYAQYGAGRTAARDVLNEANPFYGGTGNILTTRNPRFYESASSTGARGGGGSGGGGEAKASLSDLRKEMRDLLAELDLQAAQIAEKVRDGLMSSAEGEEALQRARREAANGIAELIPKLEQQNKTAGPDAAAAIELARTAVKGIAGDLQEAGQSISGIGKDLGSSFADAFGEFAAGAASAEDAMKSLENAVTSSIARMFSQKLEQKVFTPIFGPIIDSIFSFLPFAKGGVPDAPGLEAYSGTVGDAPIAFRTASGDLGVAREAGAEAILPVANGGIRARTAEGTETTVGLRRMPDGVLGVALPGSSAKSDSSLGRFAKEAAEVMALRGISGLSSALLEAPTRFAMADGNTGVAGEAGTEAILPVSNGGIRARGRNGHETILELKRLPGGDLGVALPPRLSILDRPPMAFARGGIVSQGRALEVGADFPTQSASSAQAAPTVRMQVNVTNNAGHVVEATATQQTGAGGAPVLDVVIEQIEGALSERVASGRGSLGTVLARTYGLGRAV